MKRGTNIKQISETYRIGIKGLVQGVGFRPFVIRMATGHGLKGWVENRNDGVVVTVNGSERKVTDFRESVVAHAPTAASIESVKMRKIPFEPFETFEIRESTDVSESITEISPDIAVCRECLDDLKDQPHRIGYPLINCTHCGPRFTIIRDLPYDRPHTTMAPFRMCPDCRSEYENIMDRRFHAQPVACNRCGPVYRLESTEGSTEDFHEIVTRSCELLSGGALLAVKGTGGFHLVCNAFNGEGIDKLRRIKRRDGKPFALMFRNLKEARLYVEIGETEEAELTSWRRPIVLLRRRRELAGGIADGLATLGVMLPYMPFHHLLFEQLETPALVMTSGNFSEEPILISNERIREHFTGYVDGIITYNREILNRVDDSVTAVIRNVPMVLRRARGYAPSPIRTGFDLEGILGTGAELAGSFCMGREHLALMSQYIGDLKNLETLEFYQETYERYCRLFRFTPQLVVSDLHPDYLSGRFARKLAEENPAIAHISVQHHHAHIASGMLSAGVEGEVLGFSFDGTGFGTDGHMWGAEVMKADYITFERLFHFEYVPLPGGDKATKEPWRMGISYLHRCFGEDLYDLKIPLIQQFSRQEIGNITGLIRKKINSPMVSSAGRLFDAVAAITGLNYHSTYQAEAPMLLESAIDLSEKRSYPYGIEAGHISFNPLIQGVVEDILHGTSTGTIAAKFHHTLVELILRLSIEIRSDSGLDRIVLGGGTFQNRFLSEKVMDKLENEKFKVYLPSRIPVNDQGIAAGQLAIGAHRRKKM
ncbi:MAG: carbamoyltransferase HypF [Bacteroidales bacterium]|nr:carbamoyltransferase HypF [Bacteroidales bacterium]